MPVNRVAAGTEVKRLSLLGHFSLYLLSTKAGPVLVDTGPPALYWLLRRRLAEHGLTPSDLSGVVLSHFHIDHSGSAARLVEAGVNVWALAADAAILRGDAPHPGYGTASLGILDRLESLLPGTPRLPEVRTLPANETLFGSEWQVIATPGHSPGSLALYDQRAGDLISGDTLVAAFGVPSGPHAFFTPDMDAALRSARALLDLEPARILPGHGPILPASRWVHLRR